MVFTRGHLPHFGKASFDDIASDLSEVIEKGKTIYQLSPKPAINQELLSISTILFL
jgi:uncharacterized UPF0146 family protein